MHFNPPRLLWLFQGAGKQPAGWNSCCQCRRSQALQGWDTGRGSWVYFWVNGWSQGSLHFWVVHCCLCAAGWLWAEVPAHTHPCVPCWRLFSHSLDVLPHLKPFRTKCWAKQWSFFTGPVARRKLQGLHSQLWLFVSLRCPARLCKQENICQ